MKNVNDVFLIICTGYYGDVIITSKLTRDIKKYYPNSKVVYICDSPYVELTQSLPGVDEAIPYSRKINANFFQYLKFIFKFPYKNKISHTFIIHQNKKSRVLLAKFLGAKHITAWENFKAHENYQKFLEADEKYQNVAYFNANMLSVLTNELTDDNDIEFVVPEAVQEKIDKLLLSHNYKNLVAINPQAGDYEKCWDVNEFIKLVKMFINRGQTPVITGVSKDGGDYIRALEQDAELNPADYINMIDKTNFVELGALYKRCSQVVSVDTGSAHMASAVGTPTLVLFFRDNANLWAPINTKQNSYIYKKNISAEEVISQISGEKITNLV